MLYIAGCSPAPESKEAVIMNEIERAVVLPAGAKPLDAYGRNYAWDGPGKVVATYLKPSQPLDRRIGCDVMLENFASRPCTEKEIAESAASEARSIAAETRAGQRRWFSDPRNLPSISDGGCMQVNVEYDTATHRVLTVACNGEA
jgi:hypothetical protein